MAKKTNKSYFDRVHSWGRISTVTALCALLMFPIGICLYLNVFPPINGILAGLLKLIPTYWTVAVVEVIVYTPMLGAGGSYISFITGNISNLKLPCAISAMEQMGVKANSEEGEVVYNAMIRDDSASLSADGFTFIAEYATGGRGAVLTEQLRESAYPPPVVFKDATALVPTFAAASDEATYQSGSRTLSVLLSPVQFTISGER